MSPILFGWTMFGMNKTKRYSISKLIYLLQRSTCVGRDKYIIVLLGIAQFFLVGCYKKDLAEFKSIDTKHQQEFAFPLFNNSLTIKDSLPFNIIPMTMSDTIKIDLTLDNFLSGSLYNDVDYVEFKITTENNFPISGGLQLYFADTKGVIIDSLFSVSKVTIDAGNGNTINQSTTVIQMDKDKYTKIVSASKIYILYYLSVNPSSAYLPYTLKIYAGIKFGITEQ